MSKRKELVVLIAVLCLSTCFACSKNETQDKKTMDGETTMTEELKPNDTLSADSFASGIASDNDTDSNLSEDSSDSASLSPSASASVTAIDLDNFDYSIQELCPTAAQARRGDVQYGEYGHATYYSETCGLERGYSYLLPADYSEDKQYPVCYLLHGIFGNEYSFTGDTNNRIKEIFVNTAEDGLSDQMIVILPNMYASSDPNQQPAFTSEAVLPYDNFINDLVNDLMPHVNSTYSTLTGRDNTLLAGFSMGGRESLYIGIKRPDLFGFVTCIAPAPGVTPGKDYAMEHVGQMAEEELKYPDGVKAPHLLMVCCGTKDSVVGKFPESYHNILTTNETDHVWFEVPNADHDNTAIKAGLYNMLVQVGKLRRDIAEKKANKAQISLMLDSKYMLPYAGNRGSLEKITYSAYDHKNKSDKTVEKNAWVYLPADYSADKKYNVIYLMHGIGGNENEWGFDKEKTSRVKIILDTLIGNGDIEPVIVVTPNGRALACGEGQNSFYDFGYELRYDLIPYIESHYSTYGEYDANGYDLTAARDHRAMAGLSMGGMQTINIGICESLDIISWFGAFSAAPTSYNAGRVASVIDNSEYDLHYFYNICGLQDNIAYQSSSGAAKNLPAFSSKMIDGQNFMWQEKSGGHDFNIWYLGFYNFALLAFNND